MYILQIQATDGSEGGPFDNAHNRASHDMLERDGMYFVRFERDVQLVADRGRQLSIDFVDGDRLTLTPLEELSIVIYYRRTVPRNLRRSDQLRFHIPGN